jgi:hypothetical protein
LSAFTGAEIHEHGGKPLGSEIRQPAIQRPELKMSERLLKEYLDKATAQYDMYVIDIIGVILRIAIIVCAIISISH